MVLVTIKKAPAAAPKKAKTAAPEATDRPRS